MGICLRGGDMPEGGQNNRVAARIIQIKNPKHPFTDVFGFKLRICSKCTTEEHMLRAGHYLENQSWACAMT